MTPEQIEGYLKRLDLKYLHEDEPGPNGVFRIQFETASYRSTMPPRGKKRLKVIVSLSHDGELLMLNAPYVYHLADAKKRGVFCEYLIDLNYRIKVAQFQMDRRDGEVSCEVCLPVGGSNVSFESFKRLLYVIPFVLDHHHEETWTVMKKGKLPPVPKVPELDLVLVDLVHRVGSVAKLREIVEAHEEQARVPVKRKRATGTRRKAPGKRREQKGAADGLRNPLPPACDPTKRPSSRGAAGDSATGGGADGAADGGSGGGPRGPSPA